MKGPDKPTLFILRTGAGCAEEEKHTCHGRKENEQIRLTHINVTQQSPVTCT